MVGDMCVFAPQKSGSCAIMVGFSANPSLVAHAGCCLFLFVWDSLSESRWGLQKVTFVPVVLCCVFVGVVALLRAELQLVVEGRMFCQRSWVLWLP